MQCILPFLIKYSYLGIFAALGLGILGLPIPDETLMSLAGFLAFKGTLSYPQAVLAAFAGTICGVSIGYLLGRAFGHPFLEKYSAKLRINRKHLHKTEGWYSKYGKFAILIGYFIPGVRHLTAVFAGIAEMPYRVFATYAFTGGFLWTVTFVTMGYYLGEKWKRVYTYSYQYILPFAILAIVIFLLINFLRTNSGK
ncbi:MAG: DedA family protein [Syntrophales bacterium]|jgi:membrane protein DedA with SNARE-associated domain